MRLIRVDKISDATFNKISVGSFVKVKTNKELFWVKITKINKNNMDVEIDNNLISSKKKKGDKIKINRKHIISLYKD